MSSWWFRGMPCLAEIPNLPWPVCTDIWILASRISWYLVESILYSTHTIFPVPPAATQPQSIMDPPPYLTVGKLFFSKKTSPCFLQTCLLWFWPTSSMLVSSVQSTLFQKTSDLTIYFFCILQMLNFVLRSFFLETLPCRPLLFEVFCIFVLWTAIPVSAKLFCSSEYFLPGLGPFYLKSLLVFQTLPWLQLLHLSFIF